NLATGDGIDVHAVARGIELPDGAELYVFDTQENLVVSTVGMQRPERERVTGLQLDHRSTLITDILNSIWETIASLLAPQSAQNPVLGGEDLARDLVPVALAGETQIRTGRDVAGDALFTVATPIRQDGQVIGVAAITSIAGEIDQLVRVEREQVLQMFVIAIIVSIGLSLVLASTIANPLSDLAAAAELGRDKNARKMSPNRVRIPDLTARPDEIGRLSGAMRGMVAALYERIESNEQFAADVAHEIKNPLASLRSAVGSLRMVKKEEHRDKLLDVIDHDVRRLDRLVSDISNASRLDSELVKEEEESFNLVKMLTNLSEYLGQE